MRAYYYDNQYYDNYYDNSTTTFLWSLGERCAR
jgi:hypothetical protein